MNIASDRTHAKGSRVEWQTRLVGAGVIAAILGMAGCTVLDTSPRLVAALIRLAFDRDGMAMARALEKHVPAGVASTLDEHYDPNDEDAFLDVFYPSRLVNTTVALPTLVWVHGGAWIAGNKGQIANYLRIVADKGYTVIGVNYSIAPHRTYPAPLRQVNAALAHLQTNAQRLHVDAQRLYIAGDSTGAQIAAQLANIVSVPSYAHRVGIQPSLERAQLRGVLLYCGAYDLGRVRLEGALGVFTKTVLWSYAGKKEFLTDPQFTLASVAGFVTPAFPPTFISAGNGDPLETQSHAMADTLAAQHVVTDSLFFAQARVPAVPHEYQFDLDTEAGRQALERSLRFLAGT